MTETQPNCPNCGKPLAASAPQGLCPECLIQAGWPTEDGPQGPAQSSGPPFVPPSLEEIKSLFPQLEVLELIGKGGMGAVYKARQPELDRPVALKILAPRHKNDPGFAERFTREARALARLNHPNIVNVYDFGHRGELNYFVMEFVDGPNLREVERAGQLSAQEALAIVPQICTALQFAHDEGVVHRDIKPENILLDPKGRVKIADFGLAKIVGRDPQHLTLTQDGHVMGTPHYMAPEQIEHPHAVDHRADIYSLGVVFYELLTGELPLGKFAPPSRKVQVDVRLDEVVLKTLEKEPQRRYQQVSQVGTEVETIVTSAARETPPASDLKQDVGQCKKSLTGAKASLCRGLIIPSLGLIIASLLQLAFFLRPWIPFSNAYGAPSSAQAESAGYVLAFLLILVGALGMIRGRHYVLALSAGILSVALAVYHWYVPRPATVVWFVWWAVRVLGNVLGIVFGLWALILLTRREVREAFQAKQAHGHARPDWPWAARMALWTTAVHAIPLFLVGVFLVVVVPKYLALYSNMAMPLPAFSRAAFILAGFLKVFGVFVLPALLVLDVIILWPVGAYGGRRACRWWSMAVMGVLVLVVGGAVAGIRLPLQKLPLNRDPHPGVVEPRATYPFMARFPQGIVELLGICEHPSAGKVWWTPDGTPAPDVPAIRNSSTVHPGKNERAREFLVRKAGLPDRASGLVLRVKDAGSSAGYTVEDVNGRHLPECVATSVILPDDLETTDMKVGVALDPWETIVTRDGRGSGIETSSVNGRNWNVSVMAAVESQGDTRITVAHTVSREWEVRMVARTDSGEVTANGTNSQSTEGMSHVTFTYSGLPLEDIKRFSFQVRPYTWATFENVSLVSGHKTAVRILHARDPLPRPASAGGVAASGASRAAKAIQPPDAAVWGPVREFTLHDIDESQERNLLDLDRGILWDNLAGSDAGQALEFMKQHGIDLLTDHAAHGWALITPERGGVQFALAEPAFWIRMAPQALGPFIDRNRLAALDRGEESVDWRTYPLPGPSGGGMATLAFRTADGALGLLQITGKLSAPPRLEIRTKHAVPSDAIPVPGEVPSAGDAVNPEVSHIESDPSRPARLGPLVERVVNDDGVGERRFIDLDTGVLFTPPVDVDGSDETFVIDWMRKQGIDVMGNGGLLASDMIILVSERVFWENIAPAGIRERLSRGVRGTLNGISGSGELPGTYLFQTREGGAGILQVLGYSDDPRGIRIRYRLIETELDTADPAPPVPGVEKTGRTHLLPADFSQEPSH